MIKNSINYFYAEEKLSLAIYELSTGKGDVRAILREAFFSFHMLREEDFPVELREEWNCIYKNLTNKGPIYNYNREVLYGSVHKTIKHIRNSTGSKIAHKIVDLFFKIQNYNNIENYRKTKREAANKIKLDL